MAISDLSKEQIEQYAKESNNWKDLMIKCGYTNFGCRSYLKKKLQLFNINIEHFTVNRHNKKYTTDDIFKKNSTYCSMTRIKMILIRDYNWKHECSSCKLSEWKDQKIPIEIDHINGEHTDNRIENLRFLCPNCHALTDTYKGKNIKNKEHSKYKLNMLKENKICKKCKEPKHKNSEYCHKCHIEIKLHKLKNNKQCLDCNTNIQQASTRCIQCYKLSRREGGKKTIHIDKDKNNNK
jgi:hypothetical protein